MKSVLRCFFVSAIHVGLVGCGDSGQSARLARGKDVEQAQIALDRAQAEAKAAKDAQHKQECLKSLLDRHATARGFMAKRQHSQAFEVLYPCREHIVDPAMRATFTAAMNASLADRVKENGKEGAKQKAKAKLDGVSIGMSQQQVLDSKWGRPQHVNRTTTANGIHEQWVYGGRNYLYFEDGVLVTIQN